MHIQNLVKFYQFVLKIMSRNKILMDGMMDWQPKSSIAPFSKQVYKYRELLYLRAIQYDASPYAFNLEIIWASFWDLVLIILWHTKYVGYIRGVIRKFTEKLLSYIALIECNEHYNSAQVDWNWNLENVTSDVWARDAAVTSLRWSWPICTPGLLLRAKTRSCVWIDWYFYWKVMFSHSLNIIWGFYVILLRYVFKLKGFSSKDRPKMHLFFCGFCNF